METILTETMLEVVAQRFRLLGEPMRLRILQLLEPAELPVNEIVGRLKASQPNISKHLLALSQGGLIRRRRDGLNVFYSISDPMVLRLCDLVCRSAAQQTRTLLKEMDTTPAARATRGRRNGK
jgi:DNA-binding transcriptional ArsR family regulator